MTRVAIAGGGISGLSAAYYLAREGVASTIIESRPRLGGVIETVEVEGCTIEGGPDSFLSAKPAAMELIHELGLADQVIGSNDHLRKTYIWKSGRLVALPDGLMMIAPTKLMPLVTSPLLSWPTKFRMGMELFRAPKPKPDQSVAEFVEEHYGAEAVDYLAEPLLSGIYGGSPRQLSARSVLPRFVELADQYGSLTRGILSERAKAAKTGTAAPPLFRTLRGGMGQLTDAVIRAAGRHMELRTARAQAIERAEAGFRIRLNGDWMECDSVVLACEAHSAAALAASLDGRLGELLSAVPYSSSMTVALGFQTSDFPRPLKGFGFLIPKKERRRLVACTWVGTKFSHRVPAGKVLLRCFLGGMEDAGVLLESDETIIALVTEELHRIVGFSAQPGFSRVFRWPRSMAQYTVGHAERLVEIEQRTAAIPGLYLAGNAYHGIGIPDCIRTGKQAAARVTGANS